MPESQARSSRLQAAALTSIGEEGRPELVERKLTRSIFAGAFADGERLPSENELARLLGVSVVTVREALFALRNKGLIETRRGRGGGSFVRAELADIELHNAKVLLQMPRASLADLGLHYEMISASCAELACQRASDFELQVVREVLQDAAELTQTAWRRRITDIQMELASLSQSVNLTDEHVRVQTKYTPLLALQDADVSARQKTQESLVAQIDAISAEDVASAREVVRAGIKESTKWLISFRARLVEDTSTQSIVKLLSARTDDQYSLEVVKG